MEFKINISFARLCLAIAISVGILAFTSLATILCSELFRAFGPFAILGVIAFGSIVTGVYRLLPKELF